MAVTVCQTSTLIESQDQRDGCLLQDPVQKPNVDGNIMWLNMPFSAAAQIEVALLYVYTIEAVLKILAFTPW